MLIDAHCHLNSLAQSVKDEVISHFSAAGVLIDSSIDLKSSRESLSLSSQYSFIYNSLGFHPFACASFSSDIYQQYKNLLKKNPDKIIALGEIGLDYKADISLLRQEEIFRQWLLLAKEENLPALIHVRLDKNSWSSSRFPGHCRILSVLDDYFSDYQKIVFHCFSYSFDFLKKIVDKGGFISFSLNVLRENKKIIGALTGCPLENLLLETDSPYMRLRGNFSTPLDISVLYSYVSKLKGKEEGRLKEIIQSNARRVFKGLS